MDATTKAIVERLLIDAIEAAAHLKNQRIAKLEAENRELLSVLALLRRHRNSDDWEDPIPSDLLSRESAALAELEKKT